MYDLILHTAEDYVFHIFGRSALFFLFFFSRFPSLFLFYVSLLRSRGSDGLTRDRNQVGIFGNCCKLPSVCMYMQVTRVQRVGWPQTSQARKCIGELL